MPTGTTPTKFGRAAVAEPLRPQTLHLHDGTTALREVDHEPPIPVLDQEDLLAQGVDTAALVPGAQRVDALGSCVANAGTTSLAGQVAAARGPAALAGVALAVAGEGPVHLPAADAAGCEEFAIVLYHLVTDSTGDPATEWPPTDCGSSGLHVCLALQALGLTTGHKTASGVTSAVSLLQAGTVIMGAPWFHAWMEPGSGGFVDGDGSLEAFQDAMDSGVAGGHETCITAAERLVLTETGRIEPRQSWLRVRNSWGTSFADGGSYRIHLSTLGFLGSWADYKQLQVATGPPPMVVAPDPRNGLAEFARLVREIAASADRDISEAVAWLHHRGL